MTTSGPITFGGIESGLNTSAVINAELSTYQQPLLALQAQQSALNTQISDYQSINSQLLSLQQAADALAVPAAYSEAFSVNSSASSVATGTITSGASAGSITLAVDQMATGSTQISAGTVSSTNNVVASGNFFIGSGGAALGLTSFSAESGLASGAHSISVIQSSLGASVAGTTPLAQSTAVSASNNEIDVNLNGTALAVVIPTGTYSPSQLAQAIAQGSNGALAATIDSQGVLTLSSSQQGSSASLQVSGGSALASLGLSSGSTAYGTDGQISLDGTTTTVSNIAGTGTTSVALVSGTGGTITAQIAGGLSAGTMSAQSISSGNGSLAAVVSAINGANAGVTATALQVGTNRYALEVTSTKTGTAGAATLDTQAFAASSLGALQTTTAAQDAIVSVGGTGGYQVTSSTNELTGLLPGVTVNLAQVSSTPVTLSVNPDGSQMLTQVSALVSAANQVLSSISTDTAYNTSTNTAGPLNGATSLSALAQQVLAIVGGAVGSSASRTDTTVGEAAGLAITSTGTITFNQSAFTTAYDANPSAVQAMFTEGGTLSPSSPAYSGQVSIAGVSNATISGHYDVSISQSASQANDVGTNVFAATSSTLAAPESYTVTSGTLSATYAVSAGESIANVVSGMNAAFAAAGLTVSAELAGTPGSCSLELSSADYGSSATFNVATTGSDQMGLLTSGASYAGTDVAGTINGRAAVGSGQILSLSKPGDPADGLLVQITTPGITSLTSLGTFNYLPGFAQGLASLSERSTITPYGQLPDTISGLNNTLANVTSQIALQQELVATQKASLTQEFTNMEMTLTQLSSEAKFLADSSGTTSTSSTSSSSGIFSGNNASTSTATLG